MRAQRRKVLRAATRLKLNGAVGIVAHPPTQTSSLCLGIYEPTESDTLYTPGDAQPDPIWAILHHCASLINVSRGTKASSLPQNGRRRYISACFAKGGYVARYRDRQSKGRGRENHNRYQSWRQLCRGGAQNAHH